MFQTMKVFGQKILYGFGFGSGMGIAYSNQDVLRIDLQKVVDHCKNINIDGDGNNSRRQDYYKTKTEIKN